jgi:hypothetical protein
VGEQQREALRSLEEAPMTLRGASKVAVGSESSSVNSSPGQMLRVFRICEHAHHTVPETIG